MKEKNIPPFPPIPPSDRPDKPNNHEISPAMEEKTSVSIRRRSRKWFISGGLLIFFLAAAAFVSTQLMRGSGLPTILAGMPGEVEAVTAKELPQQDPDFIGIFEHRQYNSIFIGTGNPEIAVQQDRSGNVQASSTHDGPTVEVVITNSTTIYEDVTSQQFNRAPPKGQQIQEVVKPGSLDEIGENSMISVWGKTTGDRIIADVLLYEAPAVMQK